MNTRHTLGWLLALVLVLAAFGRGAPPSTGNTRCATWATRMPPCDLNALGAQGWELVAATPFTWNDGTASAKVFLGRETP